MPTTSATSTQGQVPSGISSSTISSRTSSIGQGRSWNPSSIASGTIDPGAMRGRDRAFYLLLWLLKFGNGLHEPLQISKIQEASPLGFKLTVKFGVIVAHFSQYHGKSGETINQYATCRFIQNVSLYT